MRRRRRQKHAFRGKPITLDPATVIHPCDHPSLVGHDYFIRRDVNLMPDPLAFDAVPDDVFDGLPNDPVPEWAR